MVHASLLLQRMLPLVVLLSGCAGPTAIRHSRQRYNEAIHATSAEQLLLNLVRLRYRDRPSFMEVTSLSTQFSFEEDTSLRVTVPEAAFDELGLGAAFAASERPTVTYDPLQGGDFVERLISPLKEETIILLIRSGWSIERVLRMTVQEMNGLENARRASGPTPSTISRGEYAKFQQVVRTLRDLQIENKVRIGYEENSDQLSGSIPAENLDADAFVAAAQQGWKLEPKQERVSIQIRKIAPSSDVTADYLDPQLFANLVSAVKEKSVRTPVRVMPREIWERQRAENGREPGTRLFREAIKMSQSWADGEELPLPGEIRDPAAEVTDEQEESQATFVAVEGERGDLLLAAYLVAGIERIPCIVEYPNKYVLTGTSQTLVMNWDAESLSNDDELLSLGLPGLKNVAEERYTLSLEPRSLIGILYFLSHAIRIPEEHETCGLVTMTTDEFGDVFDWANLTGDLLMIESSKEKPTRAAVAVKYRDYWFYIDDRDARSKATFTLLSGLFEFQAGGGATGIKPVLTLPVGI